VTVLENGSYDSLHANAILCSRRKFGGKKKRYLKKSTVNSWIPVDSLPSRAGGQDSSHQLSRAVIVIPFYLSIFASCKDVNVRS